MHSQKNLVERPEVTVFWGARACAGGVQSAAEDGFPRVPKTVVQRGVGKSLTSLSDYRMGQLSANGAIQFQPGHVISDREHLRPRLSDRGPKES